jgi:hypothetical protein
MFFLSEKNLGILPLLPCSEATVAFSGHSWFKSHSIVTYIEIILLHSIQEIDEDRLLAYYSVWLSMLQQ